MRMIMICRCEVVAASVARTSHTHPHTFLHPHTSKFSEIDRLEEQIAALVQESKGFFETDAELEERAKARCCFVVRFMVVVVDVCFVWGCVCGGVLLGGGGVER